MSTIIIPITAEVLDTYINVSYKDAESPNLGIVVFQDELTVNCIFDENDLPARAEIELSKIDFVADNYPLLLPEIVQLGGIMYPLEYLLTK